MFIKSEDGINLFYYKRLAKKPKGTLLFIHGGFNGNHTLLKRLYSNFNEYNIIAPDLRGRGDSEFPYKLKNIGLEYYASDIYQIIKRENLSDFYIVGVSFGGLVALNFLLNYKVNAKKVVLISSTYDLRKLNGKTKIFGLFYYLLSEFFYLFSYLTKERRQSVIDYSNIYGKFFNLKYGLALIKNNSLRTLALRYKMMKKSKKFFLPLSELKKINSEFLLIFGENDFFFNLKRQNEMKNSLKKCYIKIIKNTGHNLYIEKPKETAIIIKKFFNSKPH